MLERFRLHLLDRLRYSSWCQAALGLGRLARGSLTRDTDRRLERWAEAYRVLAGVGKPGWVAGRLRPYVEDALLAGVWRDRRLGWSRYPGAGQAPVLDRGLVLKPPLAGGERGVILVSSEHNLLNLMVANGLVELLRQYTLLVFTSWHPPAYPALWQLAHYPGSDVYFAITPAANHQRLQELRSGARILTLAAGDFVNPDWLTPRPRDQREIDIVMVANWAPYKRHWRLFAALADLHRPLKVVLAGRPNLGYTMADIERQAALFGVRHLLTLHNELPAPGVAELLANSKVAIILAKRDGACTANAKALLADTPIGLVAGAQLGSAAYINAQTGVFLEEATLAADLGRFLDQCQTFSPREWAMENIGNHVTMPRLNAILRHDAIAAGRPWTQDAVELSWWRDPTYSHPADRERLLPAYRQLRDTHGLTFAAAALT